MIAQTIGDIIADLIWWSNLPDESTETRGRIRIPPFFKTTTKIVSYPSAIIFSLFIPLPDISDIFILTKCPFRIKQSFKKPSTVLKFVYIYTIKSKVLFIGHLCKEML